MQYSKIAKMFHTRNLFSKVQIEYNKNASKRKDRTLYKKINHSSFLLFLREKSRKKVMGNKAEIVLIIGSTFYIWYYPNIES